MGSMRLILLVVSLPFFGLYYVLITLQAYPKTKLSSIVVFCHQAPALFLPENSRASRPKHLYKKASPHPPNGLPGHSTPL